MDSYLVPWLSRGDSRYKFGAFEGGLELWRDGVATRKTSYLVLPDSYLASEIAS